ncbi:MAG TPA: hypothetical protein PKA63_13485 [Oligoflexia bacterium]|nr:hypothetical protein [Oligoflexia bacterium]HMP49674.1 hypothetical protein [Oligoflexia bacterium]
MKKSRRNKEKALNLVFACLLTLALLLFAGIPALNHASMIAQETQGDQR